MADDAVAVHRAGSLNVHAVSFVPQVFGLMRLHRETSIAVQIFAPQQLISLHHTCLVHCVSLMGVHSSWRAL